MGSWFPTHRTIKLSDEWGTQACELVKKTDRGSWSPTHRTVKLSDEWGTQACELVKKTGGGSWFPTQVLDSSLGLDSTPVEAGLAADVLAGAWR